MTRPESPLERAERIGAELRAATQEAAGLLKDLRAAMKEARAQVDEYLHTEVQAVLNANTVHVQSLVDAWNEEARGHVEGVIKRAADRADAIIESASTIASLGEALVDQVARNTRYIDGVPHIIYGVEHGLKAPGTT